MGEPSYTVRPLEESTWPAVAALVEANNGVFGGCWCMGFHPEGVGKERTAEQNCQRTHERVREGTAHAALVMAAPEMRDELDAFEIDLVALRQDSPSAQILGLDPGWRRLLLDDEWVLLCRRGADVGGSVGEC